MIEEVWRLCPDDPAYEASSLGRVRSALTGRVLRQCLRRDGYLVVGVHLEGKHSSRMVGGMVCSAFHGKRPENHHADHIDGRRANNVPANLRWLHQKTNKTISNHTQGDSHHWTKLSDEQVSEIRRRFVQNAPGTRSATTLAEEFGVSRSHITLIVSQKSRTPNKRAVKIQKIREALG